MGREVKRVPVDFDWELNKVWEGFLRPDKFDEKACADCEGMGESPRSRYLKNLWYGYVPFDPTETGSTPLLHDTPAVRAFAERNIQRAPDFYGTGELAIRTEAQRLADLWNAQWGHHLAQEDVDALLEADRLSELTKTWTRENGWQPKDPPVHPTAAEVNEWSLTGFGHDGINQYIAVRARCEREGVSAACAACAGHGSFEAYEGQRAEAEAWEPTELPEGEGWQLWETVTEGSPVSPVFATADALAVWMSQPERGRHWVPQATAAKFIADGWAPTLIATPETGVVSGVEYVGHQAEEVGSDS